MKRIHFAACLRIAPPRDLACLLRDTVLNGRVYHVNTSQAYCVSFAELIRTSFIANHIVSVNDDRKKGAGVFGIHEHQ